MTHEYTFISPAQTLADWKAGKIQCFHNAAGESKNLDYLCGLFENQLPPSGTASFYYISEGGIWMGSFPPFPDLPSIPTDDLYAMIKGEGKYAEKPDYEFSHHKKSPPPIVKTVPQQPQEEGELVGYELNKFGYGLCGAKGLVVISQLLDTTQQNLQPLKNPEIIQRASDLGILSTCFKPVYKEREVEIELGDGYKAIIKKKGVIIDSELYKTIIPITDLKKIIEAHEKL